MAEDAAAVAAAAAAAAAAKPWFEGADAETVGHLQNRGWDKKEPKDVALEAVRAWKGAESKLGVPADQLLRLPKDAADEAGWKSVWSRLGMPADAKGYDFSGVKFSDGTALEDSFVETMRNAAMRLHLPKDVATEVTREFAKYLDAADTKESAERTAKLAEQRAALKKNWGPNEAAFLFAAQRAAAALGVDPAAVSALEQVVGYDKTMNMFLTIAQKIGEDKFISGGQHQQGGAMTREQAIAKRSELMSNTEWSKSYTAGDKEKLREMMALNTLITGVAAAA